MLLLKKNVFIILTGLLFVSSPLFSKMAAGTGAADYHSTLYLSFLYPPTEPSVVYADTLILDCTALPFILNKSRIDLFPLTPPLNKKPYLSLREKFLSGKLFRDTHNRIYLHKKAYNYIVDNRKDLIRYSKKDMAGEVETITEIESNVHQNLFKIEYDRWSEKVDKPPRYRPKKPAWAWKGTHFIQFSQTNDSKNWDKDGLGNINLISVNSFTATYQKNKWKANLSSEWRLNLANNANDTIRRHKISEDKFRSYMTVGFQALKNWSYSSNLEFITQLFPNHVENKTDRTALFLSPFKMNTGLGMNYTLNKSYPNKTYPKLAGRKMAFTADISPVSIQYVNVTKSVADPAQFGIKEGSSLFDFGTTLNAKLTVNFNKTTSYMTRINYFTNYHRVYSEWEHDLNLPVNRFFSIRLYLFSSFDDTRVKDEKYGYMQIKETFSFGFNYSW
jgi:hypothetical protein